MNVYANGISMNYELNGDGPCLVMIHGFSDNLSMWYNQMSEFSKRYKILAYDVRGHGRTETPENEMSLELFANDLKALLDALDIEKASVLGYSMGGRIGLQFALAYSEMTTGLILSNIGIDGPDVQLNENQISLMEKHRRYLSNLLASQDIEAVATALAEQSFTPELKIEHPEVLNKYKEIKLQNDPRYYPCVMQVMSEAMNIRPDFSLLKCPVLIIGGNQDALMNTDVIESMEKAIQHATTRILPTGHASAIEAPEMFNKVVLDFLEKIKNNK